MGAVLDAIRAFFEQLASVEFGPLGLAICWRLVKMMGGTSDPTLQVMAERPDTRQLTLEDCARLSRRLSEMGGRLMVRTLEALDERRVHWVTFTSSSTARTFAGLLGVGFREKLNLPSAFDLTVSDPLALRKPAAQFPNVRFIIPHLGSGMFRELLMLADSAPNVLSDTSGIGSWGKYLAGRPSGS